MAGGFRDRVRKIAARLGRRRVTAASTARNATFRLMYVRFREILSFNDAILGLIADLEDRLSGHRPFSLDVMQHRVRLAALDEAGKTLAPEEQRVLLSSLEACQSPRTCPHGRPTMIHLSVDLLERQFGRRGAR